ncbi:MAG: hypothetical protein WCP10_15570, partial [Desulfuromonadales bacterium]
QIVSQAGPPAGPPVEPPGDDDDDDDDDVQIVSQAGPPAGPPVEPPGNSRQDKDILDDGGDRSHGGGNIPDGDYSSGATTQLDSLLDPVK